MANERTHKTFGKQMAKRMVDDRERNWQSKKPKLFLDTASQPKWSQPHLFKQLHYKTPLAVLNECEKGLVINVCKEQDASHNPSFTASLELDGKTFSATGNSKRMAKQLLAETVILEMEQDIEKMQTNRAAVRPDSQNHDETEESLSTADQEALQRPPPLGTDSQSSDDIDLTSNDDIYSSTAPSAFDSVYMSASGQQFQSSKSIAPASDNSKLESETSIEVSAVPSSVESLTFSKGNAQQHHKIKIKRTAVAILNCLAPGVNWNVTKNSRIKVGSPLKESVVSMNIYGEKFEGRSSAIHLARQYAAEAALNKLFGLEFERDNVGMPLFHGNLAEIACLKKRKLKNTNFLDAVDGKNPIQTLNVLFKDEVSFQFHSHLAPKRSLKHYCTVSVAGMTFEGCDSIKANAERQAAFAAVAVLRANGMYDQKVAELEACHTGLPVQEMMVKQRAPSSAVSVRSTPGACTKSHPLPISPIPRLNKVFPGSRFTLLAEKDDLDLKGKIFTVEVLIGDQRFVGNGKRLRFARVDASRNALRAFGLWTHLDDKAEALLHVPPEIETKKQGFHLTTPPADGSFNESLLQPVLHKKILARGQGKKANTTHRIKRNINSHAVNSSYFGADNGSNDILIGGNYYDAGNKRARVMGSGAERGYNEHSDFLNGGNYYDTGDYEKVRFMGSGLERRNDNNVNDILIDANYYDTGDKCANFVGSTFSFAGRNEGDDPSVNSDINSHLWNTACSVSTGSSFSAVETAYQNNGYKWKPNSSYFNAGDPCDLVPSGEQGKEEYLWKPFRSK